MFNKIIRVSVYSLVFLVPLFFLGFSFEAFEFNKQYLLLFLTSIAALAWLGKMIVKDKEIRFKRTPLDLPVLGFMGVAILSSLLSVDKMSSLFGFYGRFSDGLIGLLCLGALFFLLTNLCGKQERIGGDKGNKGVEIGGIDKNKGKKTTTMAGGSVLSVEGIMRAFMASVVGVIAVGYMTVFGVWNWINNKLLLITNNSSIITDNSSLVTNSLSLPDVMLTRVFNTVGGSMEALAMFLVVAVVLIVGRMLVMGGGERTGEERIEGDKGDKGNKGDKTIGGTTATTVAGAAMRGIVKRLGKLGGGNKRDVFNYAVLALAVGLLFIIDFTAAWVVLFTTLILFIALAIKKRMFKENVNKLLLPILLAVVAGISMGVSYDLTDRGLLGGGTIGGDRGVEIGGMPQEQILGQGTSWAVSFGALTESPKSVFLGSGPGTYHYDFAKFKPVEFNKIDFWQIRFDRSGTHIAEILATMGILGFLCYLGIIGLFLVISLFFFQITMTDKSKSILPFLMAFSALLIAQVVYYQNTTLMFLFWLFLALGTVFWQKQSKEKVFSLKEVPEIGLVFNVILIFTCLGACAMFYSMTKFYVADNAFAKSQARIEQVEKAVKLNPYQPQYKIMLSRMYLEKVKTQLTKPLTEQDQTELSDNVFSAITYLKGDAKTMVKGAAEIAPNRVAVQETLGMIYRDIQGAAEGATDWAIKAFEKSAELEPTNPVFYTELGKLYLIQSPNDKNLAREKFEKAVEMKDEYLEAHTQIAFSYEEDNIGKAVSLMESLAGKYQTNVEILFHLGRLYFNDDKVDQAIIQFQKVIRLMPNHSNARYSLGVAYEAKGDRVRALTEFEKVLDMNPGNKDLEARIENLRTGTAGTTEESEIVEGDDE